MIEQGLYKHYKGNVYEVMGFAKHSETLEEMVVYKSTHQIEGDSLWVRPFKMFNETVIINGVEVKRFEKIR